MTVRYLWAAAAVGALACGGAGEGGRSQAGEGGRTVAREGGRIEAREGGRGPAGAGTLEEAGVVLVVGTSLTAGLGVDPADAYPARLQELIDAAELPFRVVNAGVSGETSAGALARMDWLLQQDPAVLIIETGANDGLRGLDPAALEQNLTSIVERARDAVPGIRIAIVQMEAPPNLGRTYTQRFRAAYANVAQARDVALLPFPLSSVAGIDSLNQPDGIHPTPAGHRLMAEAIWPAMEPLLREAAITARPAALP